MDVVRLRSAVCLLGRFPALAGVDLDVSGGEVVLVRGVNGAGKTTLLRLCAGLVALSDGEGTVLGHDLATAGRPLRRRVGLLGQATSLYDDLSVRENVCFWARAGGATSADADEAVERLGLHGRLADVAVAKLSTGQRRRVALAVLLSRRPELWLLDEPHAGLDAEGRDVLDALVVQAAASGATVLIASHDVERAEALAHRVIVITGGRIAGSESRPTPPPAAIPAPLADWALTRVP